MDTDQQQNNDPIVEGIDKAVDEFLARSEKERAELTNKAEAILTRADAASAKLEADDIDVFFRDEELKLAEDADELLLSYLEGLDAAEDK